ncbi:MAG: sensor domain-containing diguanylate cyclase [Bacillota bacterium]
MIGTHQDIDEKKKTELKLKKSEQKFRRYIDNAPIGIFIIDKDGNIQEINQTAVSLIGYDKKELLNMKIFDLQAQNAEKEMENTFNTLKHKGKANTECQFVKKSGERFYVRINAVEVSRRQYMCFVEDIDIAVKTRKVLQKQRAYFQQLFDKSPQAIALLNNQEQIIRINKSFEKMFGYKQQEIEGFKINDLVVPESRMEEAKAISKKVCEGEIYTGESVRVTKSGEEVHVIIYGYPITLDEDQYGIYAVYNNITKRKKEEEKIKYLSYHDQLTGLYNRRYFEEELDRLNKSRKLPISIVVADMDGLKEINDNYGHKKGDMYIKNAGKIFKKVTRNEDVVARIGGDEFAAVLPETDSKAAKKFCKRVMKKCKEFNKNNKKDQLGISIGYSTLNSWDKNLNTVFKKADRNMYQNKGRNRR